MQREFDILDDNDSCPEISVLQNYATGRLSEPEARQVVQAHIPSCGLCADVVRRLRGNAPPNEGLVQRLAMRTKRRWEMQQRLTAQGPAPGTIWHTVPEAPGQASGPLVLILRKSGPGVEEVLSVAEVSRDISQAIEDDLILERADTDLPFRCMVRTSNRFPTSRAFLAECIGQLPEHWLRIVYQFCDPLHRFDNDTGFNEDEFVCDGYGNTLLRRRGATSGVPVTDEKDPRLAFLRESMHKRRYLSREVKAAMLRREEGNGGQEDTVREARMLAAVTVLVAVIRLQELSWRRQTRAVLGTESGEEREAEFTVPCPGLEGVPGIAPSLTVRCRRRGEETQVDFWLERREHEALPPDFRVELVLRRSHPRYGSLEPVKVQLTAPEAWAEPVHLQNVVNRETWQLDGQWLRATNGV